MCGGEAQRSFGEVKSCVNIIQRLVFPIFLILCINYTKIFKPCLKYKVTKVHKRTHIFQAIYVSYVLLVALLFLNVNAMRDD